MIKGKIVDNAGEPMIGVNVLVKGTTNGEDFIQNSIYISILYLYTYFVFSIHLII